MRLSVWLTTLFTGLHASKNSNPTYFNFSPLEDIPANYQRGILNSFDGGIINASTNSSHKVFFIGSRFTQTSTAVNGLANWVNALACSVFIETETIGKFKLLGDIPFNNFTWHGKTYPRDGVIWGGCRPVIRCIPTNPTIIEKKCALLIYIVVAQNIKTGNLQTTYYGPPAVTTGYVQNYPNNLFNKMMFIAYIPLTVNTPVKINQEIALKLSSYRTVKNVNGYNYSTNVLNNCTLLDISTKTPNLPLNAVNGQPLIDATNNQEAIVKYNGTNYSILFYRIYHKVGKRVEALQVVVCPGDLFPWENGYNCYKGQEIGFAQNVEDPFCWIKENAVACIVHAFNACGKGAKAVCGAVINYQNNSANKCESIAQPLQPKAKLCWSTPSKVYDAKINNLNKDFVVIRQRPYLRFRDGNACELWTGVVWKRTPPGSCFPVEINGGCRL